MELEIPNNDYQEDCADGVPVMKIGLNEPEKKSVVMSRTEFSQAEIDGTENSE